MSSIAAAAGQHGLRARRPSDARRRQREHRPDPLAAGEQRVAHRLLEPRGLGDRREAQLVEVVLDQLAQVVRVGAVAPAGRLARRRHGPSPARPRAARPRSPRSPWPTRSAASRARASASSSPSSGSRRRSAISRSRSRAARSTHRAKRYTPYARPGIAQACSARAAAPRMPLTKPGRVGAAVPLRELHRLVDRDLGRDVVAVAKLVQGHAHDAPLQRRRSARGPSRCASRAISSSSSSRCSSTPSTSSRVNGFGVRRAASSSGRPVTSRW